MSVDAVVVVAIHCQFWVARLFIELGTCGTSDYLGAVAQQQQQQQHTEEQKKYNRSFWPKEIARKAARAAAAQKFH